MSFSTVEFIVLCRYLAERGDLLFLASAFAGLELLTLAEATRVLVRSGLLPQPAVKFRAVPPLEGSLAGKQDT